MLNIIVILTVGIILLFLTIRILNWRTNKSYKDAGKKWDKIVDELRKRK